jgi:hypothetical protein
MPRDRFIGPVICAVVFVLMAALTWRTWPDPLVDFGRELYLPWRVSLGEVLHRDVAHFSGPLSVSFNAILFKLLGPSVMTLAYANLLIFAGVCAMVYRLSREASDDLTASLATCAVIVGCGFGHLTATGNFNWVTPYSHELTHGIALSFVVLMLARRWLGRPTAARAAAVGLVFGMVILTKPEVTLAAGMMLVVLVAFAARTHARHVAFAISSALVAPCVAWFWFREPLGDLGAFHAVLGGWRYVNEPSIQAMPFYMMVSGLSDVPIRVRTIGLQLLTMAGTLGLVLIFARFHRARPLRTVGFWGWSIGLALLITGLTFDLAVRAWVMGLMPRSWTILLPVLALCACIRAWREPSPGRVVQAMACTFACAMLIKTFLAVSLMHYGFAHAMPAMVVFVTAAMVGVPQAVARRNASPASARVAVVAILIAFTIGHGLLSWRQTQRKTLALGTGSDRILIYATSGDIPRLMEAIEAASSPTDTLAAIPEGAMLNFLTGLPNPTRFPVMMPVEAIMFGADNMARSLEIGSPTWLVVRRSSMKLEYAVENIEHLPGVEAWIASNYDRVDDVEPGKSQLELYRRREISPNRGR